MERIKQTEKHLDTSILHDSTASSILITLNKPKSLNSLTLEMIDKLFVLLDQSVSRGQNLIFRGEGRSFCAGGDVVTIAKNPEHSIPFFWQEFTLFYEISKHPLETVSILDGIVMGGGVGLSQSCKIKVATPKTLWAMPETAIGFTPDVGATHFLNKLEYREIGLYLALTGHRLTGPDTYELGLSNYFVDDVSALLRDLRNTPNVKETCRGYHVHCEGKLMKNLQDIRQCFTLGQSVEWVFNRLRSLNNKWSNETAKILENMCPLSLKISYESFMRGSVLDLKGCLVMEYNLVIQMTLHRRSNFWIGIKSKLIDKIKGTPSWEPATVYEVIGIEPFFLNLEGPWLTLN